MAYNVYHNRPATANGRVQGTSAGVQVAPSPWTRYFFPRLDAQGVEASGTKVRNAWLQLQAAGVGAMLTDPLQPWAMHSLCFSALA